MSKLHPVQTMKSVDDSPLAQEFVRFAVEAGVLRFGEFKTKAGRLSPYFFNAGLFDDGTKLARLTEFYARRLLADGREDLGFEMIFGPAYKGIPLASALAVELSRHGRRVPFAYNRKEAKDHGEGGVWVGAPCAGRVLIVDDVISAGTSVRESIDLITAQGGKPVGVLIALDRQEVPGDASTAAQAPQERLSAVQFVTRHYGLPVIAVARLQDLLHYLQHANDPIVTAFAQPVQAYRDRYGV
jgi:orotate phosphoribosyltransferase